MGLNDLEMPEGNEGKDPYEGMSNEEIRKHQDEWLKGYLESPKTLLRSVRESVLEEDERVTRYSEGYDQFLYSFIPDKSNGDQYAKFFGIECDEDEYLFFDTHQNSVYILKLTDGDKDEIQNVLEGKGDGKHIADILDAKKSGKRYLLYKGRDATVDLFLLLSEENINDEYKEGINELIGNSITLDLLTSSVKSEIKQQLLAGISIDLLRKHILHVKEQETYLGIELSYVNFLEQSISSFSDPLSVDEKVKIAEVVFMYVEQVNMGREEYVSNMITNTYYQEQNIIDDSEVMEARMDDPVFMERINNTLHKRRQRLKKKIHIIPGSGSDKEPSGAYFSEQEHDYGRYEYTLPEGVETNSETMKQLVENKVELGEGYIRENSGYFSFIHEKIHQSADGYIYLSETTKARLQNLYINRIGKLLDKAISSKELFEGVRYLGTVAELYESCISVLYLCDLMLENEPGYEPYSDMTVDTLSKVLNKINELDDGSKFKVEALNLLERLTLFFQFYNTKEKSIFEQNAKVLSSFLNTIVMVENSSVEDGRV